MLCRCDATLEQQYSSLSTTTHKLTVFIGRTQRSRLRQPVHYLCTNVQTETFDIRSKIQRLVGQVMDWHTSGVTWSEGSHAWMLTQLSHAYLAARPPGWVRASGERLDNAVAMTTTAINARRTRTTQPAGRRQHCWPARPSRPTRLGTGTPAVTHGATAFGFDDQRHR